MRAARVTLIALGTLLIGYAVLGALTDDDLKPFGVLLFLAGVLIAHDGVLLPLIIGVGALITRFVPVRARPAVRSAALASLAVTLIAVPMRLGAGASGGRGLLILLAVISLTALAVHLAPGRKRTERSRGPVTR